MLLDSFEYKTNIWVRRLVSFLRAASYIDVIEDINGHIRFYWAEKGPYYSKQISKKQVQKFFDKGKLPDGIKKYLN